MPLTQCVRCFSISFLVDAAQHLRIADVPRIADDEEYCDCTHVSLLGTGRRWGGVLPEPMKRAAADSVGNDLCSQPQQRWL